MREALDSLLRQTYSNIEVIVVDDGSTDGSAKIINEYSSRDTRIKPFFRENSGVVAAANFAASQATGKYIMRTDSDDVSFDNKVADLVRMAEDHPEAALVTGNIEVIDNNGEYLYRHLVPPHSDEIKRALYLYNPVANGATMVKKELFDKVGGYDNVFAEDLHLWIKLYEFGDFIATGSALYRWRVNPTGLTVTNNQQSIDKEKEYTDTLWQNKLPAVLSRRAIVARSRLYLTEFPTYGVAYKHIFLYDLSRVAIHMLKRGDAPGCLRQLFAIASTGRTGVKVVMNRLWLIIEGKRSALIRASQSKRTAERTIDPNDPTLFP